MKKIKVPRIGVNDETAVVVDILKKDNSFCEKDEVVCIIETTKSSVSIEAFISGYIYYKCKVGDEIAVGGTIAYLSNKLVTDSKIIKSTTNSDSTENLTITKKAKKHIDEHGIDPKNIKNKGVLKLSEVKNYILSKQDKKDCSDMLPLPTEKDTERILLIGGRNAAKQVIDILRDYEHREAVAILDDDSSLWGKDIWGVPIIGATDRLVTLYEKKTFDKVVISVSTSVETRSNFRKICRENNIALANVIDKTCKISNGVEMGYGNVICAFCHFGVETRIGDNNFISAYNSYDHHNVLKSDISTGPGCMASARVTLGDRVRMGTGIFVQPGIDIGDNVLIASGSVIIESVPDNHIVKMKSNGTVVVPKDGRY
jgi:acetyltransferase-like isoleucine patch superfamily enzyme